MIFATILVSFDFKKSFNSLHHEEVLTAAKNLGVRNPILLVLAGYLEDRKTIIKWNDVKSAEHPALGGSGQGTLLPVLLFVIKMNDLVNNFDHRITELEGEENDIRPVSQQLIYVNDIILFYALDTDTVVDEDGDRIFSGNKHIEQYLKVIEEFSCESGLQLNQTKTYATTFDFGFHRTHFPNGTLKFSTGKEIEFVTSIKLLGVYIDKNLTFERFVKEKRNNGLGTLWNLKRMQASGISRQHMKMAYDTYITSKLDYGLLSAFKMLGKTQLDSIEAIQRRATHTLLSISKRYGPDVPTYMQRLDDLKMLSMPERLQLKFNEFAEKAEFDKRFASHFIRKKPTHHSNRTDSNRPYVEKEWSTIIRRDSPILSMVKHVNSLPTTPEERLAARQMSSL